MSALTNPATGANNGAKKYSEAILKLLGDSNPIDVLQSLPQFVKDVIRDVSDARLRQPEAHGKWSMIAVLRHLADSELVWAYRLRMVLAHDRPEITGYDQDLWANRLNYRSASLDETLEQLNVMRRANLRLVSSLSEPELKRVGYHIERGEESIEHMILLYAGHDLAHRRQLLRIKSDM